MELFTNSSQKGLLICTSNLQVHCQFTSQIYIFQTNLQVHFTSAFECSYKCSFCLIVILNSYLDSSF
jgi:hypothetical protein